MNVILLGRERGVGNRGAGGGKEGRESSPEEPGKKSWHQS